MTIPRSLTDHPDYFLPRVHSYNTVLVVGPDFLSFPHPNITPGVLKRGCFLNLYIMYDYLVLQGYGNQIPATMHASDTGIWEPKPVLLMRF